MKNKIFRFFLGAFLMLVVFALLAFNALLVWVATGERSLTTVTPYIEDALSARDGSYSVRVGETKLIWDGWKHPVDIRLHELAVIDAKGSLLTNFPEISLGISVIHLPLGRIVPTSLVVSNPMLNLVQNEDKSFDFGFTQRQPEQPPTNETTTFPLAALLAPFISGDETSNFSHLKKVAIKNATVNIIIPSKNSSFTADNFNINASKNLRGELKLTSNADLEYRGQKSSLSGNFSLLPKTREINGTVEFSDISLNNIASLITDAEDIAGFALPLNGKLDFTMNLDGNISRFGFALSGAKGTIKSPHLPEAISAEDLQIDGHFFQNFNRLEIEAFSGKLEGVDIVASAHAASLKPEQEAPPSPEIEADVAIKNLKAEKLKKLWPATVSPITREWVLENISSGNVPEAGLVLDIKKGDLAKPILPKEAINANIKVDKLKVRYLPEHPQVENAKGNIHIDGISLTANIDSATYLQETKLANGHVFIDDLNADNPYIKVDLNADAPASDIVHFLDLPRLKHAGHLGLKEGEITGSVKGSAKVGFYFFAPQGKSADDTITYDVKSEVSGITQNGFLGKFDGKNVEGKINVNNKGIDFAGSGEVSGANVSDLKVKYLFTPEKSGLDTFIDISATADKTAMKRLGYPDFPFLGGSLGVNAKVSLGKDYERTEANLNLTGSSINYPEIGWKKPEKEQASLQLVSEKKSGSITIPSFHLSGKDIDASGTASLTPDLSSFASLTLKDTKFTGSDIANLSYSKKDGTTNLDITAKNLNITSYMEKNEKEDSGISFKNFPAIQLNADIGQLILGSDKAFSNIKGSLSCGAICTSANLSGATGNNPFSIKIVSSANKQRTLAVNAQDAGSFLHNLGVIDGMGGGVLRLNGTYKESRDNPANSTLTAKLYISEHTIKDAPLLGRILGLASLTGFIDTLQGNGIRFSELSIPFTLYNDVATIENGKTHGPSLGITVSGTITFPHKILNLSGTIVPSYTLNSVLGNVPLVGETLMGGEGQGIFAANYTIKGKEAGADVRVNPLSILTPGFLRGLFDVFDEKK